MNWQTISAFLFHPVIFYLLEHLVIILILGFTSADSFLRPAVFPILFACLWKLTLISSERAHRALWATIISGHFVGGLFIYVESALISKWTFEAQGPTSSPGPESLHATHAKRDNRGGSAITTQTGGGSFWERCKFGYFVTTSSRNIGTPNMVKNTPPFSSDNTNYIPSRAAFLCRKAIIIVVAFLAIDLASQGTQPGEQTSVFFSAEAVPIFTGNRQNLAFEKITSRLVAVLLYWICTYLALEGCLSFTNFVFVALGIKDVSLYRPHFGPIGEAYSVRQFWG